MRNYEWCNTYFRKRSPRTKDYFTAERHDRIVYDRERDCFKLRWYDIEMHRDGSFHLLGVKRLIENYLTPSWSTRCMWYTGYGITRSTDLRLNALQCPLGYITGDFIITSDRKLISPDPLMRWEDVLNAKEEYKRKRKTLELAAKFVDRDPKYQYWEERDNARKNIYNETVPLATRTRWWVNDHTLHDIPGRGRRANIDAGFWELRPVPREQKSV